MAGITYYTIFMLTAALFAFSRVLSTYTSNPLNPMEGNMQIHNIHNHIVQCRHFVDRHSESNAKVMKQFDDFTQALEMCYFIDENLGETEVLRIIEGVAFAAEKHRFQKRKNPDKTPYIIHLLGVAHHLLVVGLVKDSDTLIAALLHDSIEDTQTTYEEILSQFGAKVALMVLEVTDDRSLPKKRRKELQIINAPFKSLGATQIKLADKWHNLLDFATQPPPHWDRDRIDEYFLWAESVVEGLPLVNLSLKQAVDSCIKEYWESRRLLAQKSI